MHRKSLRKQALFLFQAVWKHGFGAAKTPHRAFQTACGLIIGLGLGYNAAIVFCFQTAFCRGCFPF